jgi:hypothetical protein
MCQFDISIDKVLCLFVSLISNLTNKYRELPPHPNVVQMFGVSLDGPQPVIVMEYCAEGKNFLLLFIQYQ